VEIVPPDLLVIVDGREIFVRPRDMEVLALLATNAGRVLSRAAIFEAIWNRPLDPRDRSVDVAIGHLRTAFSELAPGWEFFHTHFRRGYRFEPVVHAKRRGGPRAAPRPGSASRAWSSS
jgi:DNA-binding response OmpR family regulator